MIVWLVWWVSVSWLAGFVGGWGGPLIGWWMGEVVPLVGGWVEWDHWLVGWLVHGMVH